MFVVVHLIQTIQYAKCASELVKIRIQRNKKACSERSADDCKLFKKVF